MDRAAAAHEFGAKVDSVASLVTAWKFAEPKGGRAPAAGSTRTGPRKRGGADRRPFLHRSARRGGPEAAAALRSPLAL